MCFTKAARPDWLMDSPNIFVLYLYMNRMTIWKWIGAERRSAHQLKLATCPFPNPSDLRAITVSSDLLMHWELCLIDRPHFEVTSSRLSLLCKWHANFLAFAPQACKRKNFRFFFVFFLQFSKYIRINLLAFRLTAAEYWGRIQCSFCLCDLLPPIILLFRCRTCLYDSMCVADILLLVCTAEVRGLQMCLQNDNRGQQQYRAG